MLGPCGRDEAKASLFLMHPCILQDFFPFDLATKQYSFLHGIFMDPSKVNIVNERSAEEVSL